MDDDDDLGEESLPAPSPFMGKTFNAWKAENCFGPHLKLSPLTEKEVWNTTAYGLIISLLDRTLDTGSWIELSGFQPKPGNCVLFLGKTLYSYSAPLHPGVKMGTCELNAGDNPVMDLHPIQGEVINTPSRFMPRKPRKSSTLIGCQSWPSPPNN